MYQNNIKLILLVILLMALSACQEYTVTPELPEKSKPKKSTEINTPVTMPRLDDEEFITIFSDEILQEQNSCYKAHIKYPYIGHPEADVAVQAWVNKLYKDSTSEFNENCLASRKKENYELDINYRSFITGSEKVASIMLEGWSYAGGAHGINFMKTLILDRETGKILELEDLFANPEGIYEFMSYYTLRIMRPKLGIFWDKTPDYMNNLNPKPVNFQNFVLTSKGLVLIFPQYKIAPYSSGVQECAIPLEELLPFLPKPGIWQ